ncbi:hypothetical protein Tco_0620023 [Tanacetum coccineum]
MENSNNSFVSVLKRGSQSHVTPEITKPALVLDDTCIKEFDFGMSLMGRAKDVYAIPNLPCIYSKEGFQNVKLSYLGGMWVLFEFDSLTTKEKFLNHSGIGSWFTELIQATNSFENNKRIVWIPIEGLPIKAWTPNTFQDDQDDLSSDGESQKGDVANKVDNNESDVDKVSESSFKHETHSHQRRQICKKGEVGSHSEDPFNIYGILDGQKNNVRSIFNQNRSEVDKLIDQGKSNDEILIKRITLLNDLQELNNRNAMEISQKAKIRWSIEGDENSKYFHGIMNKKRSQLAIRGTLANGEWISEPHRVKNEFFTHFKKQFSPIQAPSICFDFTFLTRLSSDQVQDLDCPVTFEAVKKGCLDVAQQIAGLDGFSFWNFMLLISVKWDYLDETLKAFGFGLKWRNWISSCLNNAMGSVLVNGSPTLEFQFHKGLKQGLKINLHKSKLMGIGVSSNVVAAAASLIGCSILTAPFNYLGVKVGSNMSRINSWDDVISKIFLLWRLMVLVRKLAWIGWNMVLTSKKNGGLVLLKLFGNKRALDTYKLILRKCPWQDVILAIHSLQRDVARRQEVVWSRKNLCLLCSKVADLVLPNISDRWCWSLEGSQEFSVKSSRILIDNTILPNRLKFQLDGLESFPSSKMFMLGGFAWINYLLELIFRLEE